MSLEMSTAERQEFLAGLHVAVLSVAAGDTRGPLSVPVWYEYRPGGRVSVITGRHTQKALAIQAAGRMSLCAQDENPPYRFVSVEGPVVAEDVEAAERLEMARRYLGAEGGDQYVASNPDPEREMMVFRMRPERWAALDFGKAPG
jgi:nitroimidazol reductase NimA-like FMN-containing flavoprotein (pyridoxamine 5'-phosphate oxidase superfamily)